MKKKEIPFGWIAVGLVVAMWLTLVTTPKDGVAHYGRLGLLFVLALLLIWDLWFVLGRFLDWSDAWEADRPRQKAVAAMKRQRSEKLEDPAVAAVLVSTTEETGKGVLGTAARGTLGYLTFGVFGAAVGVTTARNKTRRQRVTFSVKYASGKTGVETVEMGSKRFNELAALLVK